MVPWNCASLSAAAGGNFLGKTRKTIKYTGQKKIQKIYLLIPTFVIYLLLLLSYCNKFEIRLHLRLARQHKHYLSEGQANCVKTLWMI